MPSLKVNIIEPYSGATVQICDGGTNHCQIGDSGADSNLTVTGTTALEGAVTCSSTISAGAPTFTGALTGTSATLTGGASLGGDLDMNSNDLTDVGAITTTGLVTAASLTVSAATINVAGGTLSAATRAFGTFDYTHSTTSVTTDANGFGVSSITVVGGDVRITLSTSLATTEYVVLLTQIEGTAYGNIDRGVASIDIDVTNDCKVSFVVIKA